MRIIIGPAQAGIEVARHLIWYVSYHVSGDARRTA